MFDSYIEDLQKAQRPVLLIGGGVRSAGAVELVREIGETLKIPCIPTWNAVDVFTNDYPYYRGRIGTYGTRFGNFTIQNSDLVLALGCRFSGRITGGRVDSFARGAKIYAVDVDKAQLENSAIKIHMPICMDAKQFLENLALRDAFDFSWWLTLTKAWMDKYPVVLPEYYEEKNFVHPYVFMKELSYKLTKDDIIVADCGGNVVVTYQAFETKWGQRLISSHGNSPMGFSFAGAIGAALARPDKRVICLIGDGGFNMNIQELQTIKNYGIKNLKVFIMNNHIYGMTRQFQNVNIGGRWEASGPKGYNPPDFKEIIKAYGIKFWRLFNKWEGEFGIKGVLEEAVAVICDVDMGEFCEYKPRISGWTPIEDMEPLLPLEELKSNMFIPVLREK